jgi:hypothetical protein
VAVHREEATAAADYHRQYDEGAFLDALRATRTRQGRRILALLRRHLPAVSHLADFGAGRGFFLAACRDAGIAPLAGLDTSTLAVEGLGATGIESHLLSEEDGPSEALRRVSFRPRVVSFLDVIEHFPPSELAARLRGAMAGAGEGLELMVIKVPVPGLLYAGASVMSSLGAHGPLRQLYQAGTWPPHFNYFSAPSAERLLASAGLSVIERVRDPDFDPDCFGQRIGAKGPAGRALARIGGGALAAAVRITGRFDSMVFFARPASPGRPRDP